MNCPWQGFTSPIKQCGAAADFSFLSTGWLSGASLSKLSIPREFRTVNSLLERPPSLLRRILRVWIWGLSGGVLTTIAGLFIHHAIQGAEFRVYEVRFEGNTRSTSAQLRHLSDVRTEQHLLTVDLDRAVTGVEQHPWIRSATARLSYPSTVTISVSEHKPQMLLALTELWYVNEEGQPFRRALGHDLDYPILTGIEPDFAGANPELTSAIIGRSLDLLDSTALPPLYGSESISEIRFHTRVGFALVLRGGTEIVLGFADPAERISRLSLMVDAGLDLSTPQHIDLVAEKVATAGPLPELESL